jgi:DNA-binding response OmpR family regulator
MFLLISNYEDDHHWCRLLREALAPLGSLDIQRESTALRCLSQNCYDLIIVDAATTDDVPQLVCHLRDRQPKTRIIVASASPTWQRARVAFQAGAMDYIRKSLSKKELLFAVEDVLARIPPS